MFDAAGAGAVIFTAATGLDANAIVQVQAQVHRRLLRVFVRRGLRAGDDARAMAHWQHDGGFSVDASIRTARGLSGCCVTAPGHRWRCNDCTKSMPSTFATRAPSLVQPGPVPR